MTVASKNPVHVVTERMLSLMADGVVPWRKPWTSDGKDIDRPENFMSGRAYRGMNSWALWATAISAGYTDNRWMTFNQARKLRAAVRKGEKGTPVIFWKVNKRTDNDTGKEVTIPFARMFYVFNVAQIDGLKVEPVITAPKPWNLSGALVKMDSALAGYITNGPKLHHGGNRAFYAPGPDSITMPEKEKFHAPVNYYATLAHEAIHSTGHSSRLDRLKGSIFGDDEYSKEELVAELGAATIMHRYGLLKEIEQPSAAYLKGWFDKIKDEPGIFYSAASAADKAVTMIIGEEPDDDTTDDEE